MADLRCCCFGHVVDSSRARAGTLLVLYRQNYRVKSHATMQRRIRAIRARVTRERGISFPQLL
ncbi:hypothetical protein B2J88_24025 [Rhodococcus sp. SRB_17]|nr:hypothetical protein [Rhodococcus sp. SRB_17]